MEADKQSLEKLYADMSLEDLRALNPSALTNTGKEVLAAELAKRDLPDEQLTELQTKIKNAPEIVAKCFPEQ